MGVYWKCMIYFLVISGMVQSCAIVKITEKLSYIESKVNE